MGATGDLFVKEPSRIDYGGMVAVFDDTSAIRSTCTRTDHSTAFANVVCACAWYGR
jgi:hypothetical protein